MNKYKKFSKAYIPEEKEIAITYGVKFISDADYKPHKHSQERPYLVLCKENKSGKIISLKLGSADEKYYATDYMIKPKDYDYPTELPKTSNVCLKELYELENGDFIRQGFKISDKDYFNILEKIMYLYAHGVSEITCKQARKIKNLLYGTRQLTKGEVIRVPYFGEYILIIGTEGKYYQGVLLEKEELENELKIRLFKHESHIDLNKEPINIEKKDAFYIYERIYNKKHIKEFIVPKLRKYYKTHDDKVLKLCKNT